MPPPSRDATQQKIYQKLDGTQVWVGEWSAENEALFLPTGALDFPTSGGTDLDPPPNRVRIFFDPVANSFKFRDEVGAEFGFGGGATNFLGLTDTPGSFAGAGTFLAAVNAGETALEFIDPASVGVTDHGALGGLADDDHLQYLLLAGRAGGQQAIGGTAVSEELILRGTTNANLGLVRLRSPIVFDDVTPANALQPYSIRDASVSAFTAGFVGGTFSDERTVTFTNSLMIYEVMRGAPNIQSLVAPGFAAFTLFQALPLLRAGAGAGFNPLGATVINAGPAIQNEFAGTKTVVNQIGFSYSPQVRTTLAAAVLNVTNQTGLRVSPTWSTVAGSTVGLGTIFGVNCFAPAVGLFQPQAGVENLTAYYGINFANITKASTGDKVVVRSAMTDAADRFFLQNNGGARSDFGGGSLFDCGIVQCLGDGIGSSLSLGAAGGDVLLYWDGSALRWNPLVGINADWTPFANYWSFGSDAAAAGVQFNVDRISFGIVAANPTTTNWFTLFTGPNLRGPTSAGFYSDVLWTAGGLIDVAGFAMTEINGFRIDANVTVLNGGSVQDQSTLFVAGMGFPGSGAATRLQSLRVTGRSRFDGVMNHNEATLAQLTANVAALALPITNSGRFVLLEDADANGPWTIQGIVNVQPGDSIYLVNTGANPFVLGHQDAAAAAANRIIVEQGHGVGDLTIKQDEFAKLWYDPVATRWRVLETNGDVPHVRAIHFDASAIGKGVTAPTDVTIGTTPAVPALLFDAIAETAVIVASFRPDMDLGVDFTLKIQFALVNAETNLDQLDVTIDYVVWRTNVTGNGPNKTSTQLTPTLQVTTGNGLAVNDVYSLDVAIPFGDATNPLNAVGASGISIEFHLTNLSGVAAIHALDADLEYTALF